MNPNNIKLNIQVLTLGVAEALRDSKFKQMQNTSKMHNFFENKLQYWKTVIKTTNRFISRRMNNPRINIFTHTICCSFSLRRQELIHVRTYIKVNVMTVRNCWKWGNEDMMRNWRNEAKGRCALRLIQILLRNKLPKNKEK